MNTIYLIVFLTVLSTLIYLVKNKIDIVKSIFVLIMSGLISVFMAIFLVLFATFFVSVFFNGNMELRSSQKLVSLKSTSGIAGSFFLGSGSIGTNEYYFYYTETKDGGFIPGKVFANYKVVIYEEERVDGSLEEYCAIPPLKNWIGSGMICKETLNYKIRIPKGSFVKGYRVE